MMMSAETSKFTVTNFYELESEKLKECFSRGGAELMCSGIAISTQHDPNFGDTLKQLRKQSSEILLGVHEMKWDFISSSYHMVVEKLKFKGTSPHRPPATPFSETLAFLDHCSFEQVKDFGNKRIFSSTFKNFIRKTIKLVEVKAKDGIYIRISPDTILISYQNEFKLYDLRSHFKDLSSSYKSLYSMIDYVVVKSYEKVGIDSMSKEVIAFISYVGMPMNLHMSGHPAILLPEEKLYFFQRVLDACISQTPPPIFPNLANTNFMWIYQFKNNDILKEIVGSSKADSYEDIVVGLLRAIAYMRKHVNLKLLKVGRIHSKLLTNHNKRLYTDIDFAKIVDKLFPLFATLLFEALTSNQIYLGTPKLEKL